MPWQVFHRSFLLSNQDFHLTSWLLSIVPPTVSIGPACRICSKGDVGRSEIVGNIDTTRGFQVAECLVIRTLQPAAVRGQARGTVSPRSKAIRHRSASGGQGQSPVWCRASPGAIPLPLLP